ncbi:MAG: beta-galactosidase [Candidatus Enteromonas sp.]|nr:beta-galactosidase [Candidatus Enteromonas sp.]
MITIANKFFWKDGKPFFPVIGEFQYSRTFEADWDKDMKKMKALGINAIASYSFWIHHEEIQGEFDFSGNKNIRKFLQTAKDNHLLVSLRLGPWVHGECRNGGFPDWIYQIPCRLRSNDPVYMDLVRKYFSRLYQECQGYMEKDGGPVFAIQIENEYAQWGKSDSEFGDVHILALEKMLREIGFEVPVYLATGWGNAATGNALPVWGAYAAGPWERHVDPLPPLEGFLFSPNPNDKSIGSDSGIKDFDLTSKKSDAPYATIELGSGIQATKLRRPLLQGADNASIVCCRLGSGVDALGYYVFHGGIHPMGKLSSTQEYRNEERLEAGSYCDLAERDYDFQAAVSQYGRVHPSGLSLRLWNWFADTNKEILLGAEVTFFEDNAIDPEDLSRKRYAFRHKGDSGFLFINRYVRNYEIEDRELSDYLKPLGISAPNIFLPKKFGAFPVNLPIGEGFVRFSLATPFMVLNSRDVLFAKTMDSDYMDGDPKSGKFLFLSQEDAERCYSYTYQGKDIAVITDGEVYADEKGLHVEGGPGTIVKIYPDVKGAIRNGTYCQNEGEWGVYSVISSPLKGSVRYKEIFSTDLVKRYRVEIDYPEDVDDAYLSVDFEGDSVDLLVNGKKENDRFYIGAPFEIGLRAYRYPSVLELEVHALSESEPRYLEKLPHFENGVACSIRSLRLECLQDALIIDAPLSKNGETPHKLS